MNRIAIVIPVFNEEKALGDVLIELQDMSTYDVLVVDDASTDKSISVARSFSGVQILPLRINIGAWGALQTGMRYALKKGYSHVVTMDGDGQHHSSEIAKLIAASHGRVDSDVVIGACTERGSKLRHWAWAYFRKMTGVGIEDITSGFRLYNKQAMRVLTKKRGTLLDYQDVGVLLLLQDAGLSVSETTVEMSSRQAGKSHIYYSWFAVAYYMLFTTVLSLAKGKPFRVKRPRES